MTPWEKPVLRWRNNPTLLVPCWEGSFWCWYFFAQLCCCSVAQAVSTLLLTPWPAACRGLSVTICWSTQTCVISSVMSSSQLSLSSPFSSCPFNQSPSIEVFVMRLALCTQLAKVLELFKYQIFQWIFRIDFVLGLTDLICTIKRIILFVVVFNSTAVVNRIKLAFNIKIFYKIHNEGKSSEKWLSTYF